MRLSIEQSKCRRFVVRMREGKGRVVMTSRPYRRKAIALKLAKRIRTQMAMEWQEIADLTLA